MSKMRIIQCLVFAIILAISGVSAAEHAADGEVREEGEEAKIHEGWESAKSENDEASSDVATTILFTTPLHNREMVGGRLVKFLIGFANRGEKDFIVKLSDTSFRYPMDYSYHVQNFTTAKYDLLVQPKQEATFDYAFIPSEQYIGRPLGLVVNLHYVDQDGKFYSSVVFNETVTIVEDETSFNTETGFLYVLMAAIVIVLLFLAQHYFSRSKFARKQHTSYQQPAQEMGTNKNEVDFEWIPRTYLVYSEKKSPKMGSPRNRKAN